MTLILPVCRRIHAEAKAILRDGDVAVDATAGRGNDTLFLAEAVGDSGSVYAFDIQKEALAETEKRLTAAGWTSRVRLIAAGHEEMGRYLSGESPRCILFNLGYLPGSDGTLTTRAETTLAALAAATELLAPGGAIFIAAYRGHDGGREYEALAKAVAALNADVFAVEERCYPNKNDAPVLWTIEKKLR